MITNQGIFLKMIPDGQEMKKLIFKETQNSKSILEGSGLPRNRFCKTEYFFRI